MGDVMTEAMSVPFDLLLGRRTCGIFSAYWPHAPGLVDEYRLWVFPVVLGSGKRLFADGTIPAALNLVDTKVSTTGVGIGTYEPEGDIVTGSFAQDQSPEA
jgi:hypothetical protein